MNCGNCSCELTRRTDFHPIFIGGSVTNKGGVLRALPVVRPGRGSVRRVCKRPLCAREIDQPTGRSRPRDFCSDTCRVLYHQERKQVRGALLEAQRLADQYEVEALGDQTPPTAVYLGGQLGLPAPEEVVLGLIAQALDQIRIDIQDGSRLEVEEVILRLTQAKERADRYLKAQS
jgi:hypothetical protein